jgi:hypothetical protein
MSKDGEYYITDVKRNKTYRAHLNSMGFPVPEEQETDQRGIDFDPSPPTKWGQGLKGPRREEFPLPDEYTLDPQKKIPLDATTVRDLTRIFAAKSVQRTPRCIQKWTDKLDISEQELRSFARLYSNQILTPRDYYLHHKHIMCRQIGTYNRYPGNTTPCRFCGLTQESSTHLGECPHLSPIFDVIDHLTQFHPPPAANSLDIAR